MHWKKISPYCLESDAGYTVAKFYIRDEAAYLAWAPNPDYRPEQRKAHYARGEAIPQPHHCLGRFHSASDAQRACREHQRQQAA